MGWGLSFLEDKGMGKGPCHPMSLAWHSYLLGKGGWVGGGPSVGQDGGGWSQKSFMVAIKL